MKIHYMIYKGFKYEIKWYRNAIGEPVISYITRLRGSKIIQTNEGDYKELMKVGGEKLEKLYGAVR